MHTTSLPAAVLNRSLICPFVSVSPATYNLKSHINSTKFQIYKFKNENEKKSDSEIDLGIMDETVAGTRIGRQFSGAGKLQALYNSLHIIIAQSNTQKCFE
jgi:hypothetical protein